MVLFVFFHMVGVPFVVVAVKEPTTHVSAWKQSNAISMEILSCYVVPLKLWQGDVMNDLFLAPICCATF